MRRLAFLLSLIASLCIGIRCEAASFLVDSTADAVDAKPGDGKCSTAAGHCTLRAAVQEANAELGFDTITLPAGTYVLTIPPETAATAAAGDLDVTAESIVTGTANVTIIGDGLGRTIIDGGGHDRIFQIRKGVIADISSLTIRNGKTPDGPGGAIFNAGRMTLTDVDITGNHATSVPLGTRGDGGGIYSEGELRLTNVRVRENAADSEGGGIFNRGMMMIVSGLVADNTASTGQGGGIENRGTLSLANSTVRHNTSGGAGGGIDNVGGTVTAASTTVSDNTAAAGGGMRNLGTAKMHNCTVSGNHASQGGGGGLLNGRGNMITLDNVTITANRGNGGGIANQAGGVIDIADTIVAANRDDGGRAPDCSGALISMGHNLIGSATGCTVGGDPGGNIIGRDPKLGTLGKNGGATETHALLPGSPAIDAGSPAKPGSRTGACQPADQRGVDRPLDGDGDGTAVCDIGAFELQPSK